MIIAVAILDLALLVGIIYSVYRVMQKKKEKAKKEEDPAATRVNYRNRFVFSSQDKIFTREVSQEKPAYVHPLGIAPTPPKTDRLPRKDSLDYGVVEPWEVRVDVEHGGLQNQKKTEYG